MKEGGKFQFQTRTDQTGSEQSPATFRWSRMSKRRILSPGLMQPKEEQPIREKGVNQH